MAINDCKMTVQYHMNVYDRRQVVRRLKKRENIPQIVTFIDAKKIISSLTNLTECKCSMHKTIKRQEDRYVKKDKRT